jgi:hypothetical protein
MTQDEIIEMAKKAGLHFHDFVWTSPTDTCMYPEGIYQETLEAFAKLVAAKAFKDGYEKGIAAFAEAVELEREATIKIIRETPFSNWFQADVIETIRARGEA